MAVSQTNDRMGETIGEGRVRVREALVEMKKTIAEIENLPSTVVKFSI
jgi:hypothetical protein